MEKLPNSEEQANGEEDESLLFNLVYCSRAVEPFSRDALNGLISSAQRRNAQKSVTGWLVYSHGIFFQWLEGAREDVRSLMDLITADPRHSNVVVLSEAEEVRDRVFSGWDMELVSEDEIRAVLLDAISASNDGDTPGKLKMLIAELDVRKVGVKGFVDL